MSGDAAPNGEHDHTRTRYVVGHGLGAARETSCGVAKLVARANPGLDLKADAGSDLRRLG